MNEPKCSAPIHVFLYLECVMHRAHILYW